MTYKVKISMCNVLAAFFSVRLRWAYKSGGDVYKRQVLAKYGKCEIHFDENVSEEIKAFEDREQSFAEFSKKAKDIRENHPVVSEFEDFKESLVKKMCIRDRVWRIRKQMPTLSVK